MISSGYTEFAEALVFVHGARAPSEAARHALLCEKSGDTESAARWRSLQMQLSARLATRPETFRRCA